MTIPIEREGGRAKWQIPQVGLRLLYKRGCLAFEVYKGPSLQTFKLPHKAPIMPSISIIYSESMPRKIAIAAMHPYDVLG
jgi:hypothetical protein